MLSRGWLAPATAVPVTSVVVALLFPLPRGQVLHAGTLCLYATAYLVGAVLVAGAAVAVVRRTLPLGEREALAEAWWQASVVSVWMAPLGIYPRQGSAFAIVCSAVLGCAMVWLATVLRLRSVRPGGRQASLAVSFLQALLLHAGMALAMAERTRAAAVVVGFVAGALLWRTTLRFRQDAASGFRQGMVMATALLVTVSSLSVYLRPSRGRDGTGDHARAVERAHGDTESRAGGGMEQVLDSYKGVIVWPETQKTVTLVPPLPAMPARLFGDSRRDPLSIPFFGVYWFFRAPQSRPPKGSFETRGDPSRTTFRSTDATPMRMEARQNLGILVDLDCCKAIRLALRNNDRYPESVDVEVILFDTVAGGRALRLGRRRVVATGEELEFEIPGDAAMRRFDEIVVRFHLSGVRSRVSARMGIERFVLVPRG